MSSDSSSSSRLTQEQLDKAKAAIEFLSSLPKTEDTAGPSRGAGSSSHIQESSSAASASGRVNVLEATDKALAALVAVPTKRKIKDEVNYLFKYKKGKGTAEGKSKGKAGVTWRHRFVCLAYKDQRRIPTTDKEKDDLLKAGLGEKVIVFDDLDMGPYSYREKLLQEFPRLEDGGGFILYKCCANSRNLEPLSQTVLSSPRMLKERAGTSRTYIVPLQQDLDVSPFLELPEGPLEKCFTCGKNIPLALLQSHLQSHQESPPEPVFDLTGHDDSSDEELPSFRDFLNSMNNESDGIEREMVNSAVDASLSENAGIVVKDIPGTTQSHSRLEEVLYQLNNTPSSYEMLSIEVRRNFVVRDAMREASKTKFNPSKTLKVNFIGESSIDSGGPRREFFRLLAYESSRFYMRGGKGKYMASNVVALQANEYYKLGMYTVMSILQGGCGLPCLAEPFYKYLISGEYVGVSQYVKSEDLLDMPQLKIIVDKLQAGECDEDIRMCFATDEGEALLSETGFRKPLSRLTISDRQPIIEMLLDYYIMVKVKAEMDQFKDGLKVLGFLKKLQEYPDLFQQYFMNVEVPLTADILKGLLEIDFCQKGSIYEGTEQQAYVYFADFIDECEAGGVDCSLKDVLVFITGSDVVPPTGFDKQLSLSFKYSSDMFPTSSTCDLTVWLPTAHKSYEEFKESIIWGVKGNDGFGNL